MDKQKFISTSFSPRTATVPVPELLVKEFKVKPEWTVRGLSGVEIGRINQMISDEAQEKLRGAVAAIAGTGDKAQAIGDLIGTSGVEVTEETRRRIEMLTVASVEPVLGPENRDVAVQLNVAFGTFFQQLTTRILLLTGQGYEVGKQKRSGKKEMSD